jgi:aminoglycoside phosphotransferase (APT) family kinase protein
VNHGLERQLLEVLRAATKTPKLELDGEPRRLTGGFWAELLAFRLLDAPDGWGGDLVARVMPDPGIAAKESAIQAEIAAQGFPTPAVHLAGGPDDGLGRAFMVMDLADGAPMLDGLGGARAFASLPTLARRLPRALGEAMAALHRLDVAPLRARLAALDGTGPAVELRDFVARLHASAGSLDRPDLATAARWLDANPPPPEPEVICHGDLHPFNLLVDAEDTVTVLDWSAALLAPAAYDVAFTSLLLSEPPLAVPRPLAPLTRSAGRLLARRFRRSYLAGRDDDIDPISLRWHEGVVCLRALVEVAHWAAAGELDAHRGHPWLISGPAFAGRLHRLTGTAVRSR